MKKLFLMVCAVGLVSIVGLSVSSDSSTAIEKAFEASYKAEAEGKLDEAYRVMDVALGPDKSVYEGVMRLAYLKSLSGKSSDAALLYGRAAEIEVQAVEPLVYQQYQQILTQDWAGLGRSAERALAIDPQNYTARTRLGYSYYMRAQYGRAAEEYSKVQTLYPLDVDVMVMRGWSYALAGSKNQARRIFRKALMLSPTNASAKEGLDFASK